MTVPTIHDHRPGAWLRTLALGAVVILAVVVLASCTPSGNKVEQDSSASALRRVGINVTANQLECWVDKTTKVTTLRTTTEGSCRRKASSHGLANFKVTYVKVPGQPFDSASAVVNIDAWWLDGQFAGDGTWTVVCSWARNASTDNAWKVTSCSTPTRVVPL